MKKTLAFLADFGCKKLHIARYARHDDALRANQGDRSSGFSFWRALVS
jgi:hypothetical protein